MHYWLYLSVWQKLSTIKIYIKIIHILEHIGKQRTGVAKNGFSPVLKNLVECFYMSCNFKSCHYARENTDKNL